MKNILCNIVDIPQFTWNEFKLFAEFLVSNIVICAQQQILYLVRCMNIHVYSSIEYFTAIINVLFQIYAITAWETTIFSNHVYIIIKINSLSSSLNNPADLFVYWELPTNHFEKLILSYKKRSRISRSDANENQIRHPDTLSRWKYYVKYRHRDIKFPAVCFLTILNSRPATCCLLKYTKQMSFFLVGCS